MASGRWTAVTPTGYAHEREAFEQLKAALPDTEPYHAWSNFTFTASTGHPYEVDTLILGPAGLFLIEVKSWVGEVTASGNTWVQTAGGKPRYHDNPYHLADAKAKKLKGLLRAQADKTGGAFVPFVQAAVYFSKPGLQVKLPGHHRAGVYGTPSGLPQVAELITAGPRYADQRVTAERAAALVKLLGEIGIRRSPKYYQVGMWDLDPKPFTTGPTWQDHLARHRELEAERRRVRIYLVEQRAAQDQRESVERAAKREVTALRGIDHPNIVRVDTLEQHEAGPALIYRYDPRSLRLDQYLSQHGHRLALVDRVALVRQFAEAMAYAHGRRLYHRSLSARSVFVIPAGRSAGLTEEQAWHRPRLEVIDWHVASRGDAEHSDSGIVSATDHAGFHLNKDAGAYMAPEWKQPGADPVALDVFGVGAVTYALLTGEAPASDHADLLQRLAADNGLVPSSLREGMSTFADELVQAATAPLPDARLATVAEFLEMLAELEREISESGRAVSTEPVEVDPLEARDGDRVGEWEIIDRLGTGSTSRAFLGQHVSTGVRNVLKVALSEEKARRLADEAAVLARLRNHSSIIRLERPDPIEVGGRTALVFEFVSAQTLARKLREDGRLTVDELDAYGDQLFEAMSFLEAEGVKHRDIKPDNIVIRIRPNRTKTPVIFDFSLAGVSVRDLQAGTRGYLDPFLGTGRRQAYDQAAEWYALAVTLHEMASGQLPTWGDGRTEARFTLGPPTLATEAFDPILRDGLAEFFVRTLHRDLDQRFGSLREMRHAWAEVFRRTDDARVPTVHPDEKLSEEELAQERDDLAARATRETHLQGAGLSPRAVSAASRVDANTVGELLNVAGRVLFNLPGMGANTRKELQRRIKEWRQRLGDSAPVPSQRPATRTTASAEPEADDVLSTAGLDDIAALLVPESTSRNQVEVDATRLMLGLPDVHGAVASQWPQQPQVAKLLSVTSGRIAQIMIKQRQRWHESPVIKVLHDEVVTLLAQRGRIAGVRELAEGLLASRGSVRIGQARLAVALGAVRAAVEIDSRYDEPQLMQRRHGEQIILALEATTEDGPDTPSAPALLTFADALGRVADRLASEETLPSSATVIRALRAVTGGPGVAEGFDERRLVQLAAAASQDAACNARLEIYPKRLAPERALRLAQAGIVPPNGATPAEIRQKVSAWFPALQPLPNHPDLGKLLDQAGFKLRWERGRYYSPAALTPSAMTPTSRRSSTSRSASRWTAESPELVASHQAEEQLAAAFGRGGFKALTVRLAHTRTVVDELTRRFSVDAVDVAGRFLDELHSLVEARPKPTWETVVAADLAPPNSTAAIRFGELADQAWAAVGPKLRKQMSQGGVVLLHNAAVFGRYRGMPVLADLRQDIAQGRGSLWLLCPVEDITVTPRLDRTTIEVAPHEWTILNDSWITKSHLETA